MNEKLDVMRYKTIFDNVYLGIIFVDLQGIIFDLNIAAEKILGLSNEEVMKRQVNNIECKIFDMDGLPFSKEKSPINKSIQSKEKIGPETIGMLDQQGKSFKWLSVTSIPIFDENFSVESVCLTFEDITTKREAEKRYEQLFNEMLDGFALHEMIYDDNGNPMDYRYLAVNQTFKKMLGIEDVEIVGKSVLELMPQTEPYWIETFGVVASTANPVWFEQYSGALGKPFEVKAFCPEKGKFAVIVSDISVRKQMELELQNELIAAKNSNQSKSKFLTIISHEIRTPVNSVLGILSLLELSKLDDEQLAYIDLARKSSEMLITFVDDVLTLSKIESGKMTLDEKPLNIREIIDNSWALFSNRAKLKSIEFNLEYIGTVNEILIGDPTKITQILLNLLSNSVKFTSLGQITLSVKQFHKSDGLENALCFIVSDSGIGMSDGFMRKLFLPFEQEHHEHEKLGSGLGLMITKELVDILGGTITVESTLGEGSIFEVTIPIKCI